MSAQSEVRTLYTRQEIASTINRLAYEIRRDYQNRHPLLVGILKGSFVFMADLVRMLDFPLEVEFIRLSSYHRSSQTTGTVRIVHDLSATVKDRDVLVIEDIVDTGLTTGFLMEYLQKRKPASLKLCAMTDKPARRQMPIKIDYLGFTVPNKFIVGYGLDYDEKFRNLADICVLEVGG